MADLTELQSAQTVKIAGATTAGVEDYFVDVTPSGQIQTIATIKPGGTQGAITVGTSAILANVSGTNLTERKTLTVCPTAGTIYWGYTNTVTTSSGSPIFKNETKVFQIEDSANIYLIAGTNTNTRVTESP